MSLELPFGIKVINPKPLDHYYSNDGTPYVSTTTANAAIPSAVRYIGLTCIIGTVEYWYKDGITDPDLVTKSDSDKHDVHNQGVPSATWNVNHNLDKYPSVTVIDSGDNVVVGDVQYTDSNNLTITFSATFSGTAYMN